jgi:hypothetical protein
MMAIIMMMSVSFMPMMRETKAQKLHRRLAVKSSSAAATATNPSKPPMNLKF